MSPACTLAVFTETSSLHPVTASGVTSSAGTASNAAVQSRRRTIMEAYPSTAPPRPLKPTEGLSTRSGPRPRPERCDEGADLQPMIEDQHRRRADPRGQLGGAAGRGDPHVDGRARRGLEL